MKIDTEEKKRLFELWKSISSHVHYIAPEDFDDVFDNSIKMLSLMLPAAYKSSDEGDPLFTCEEYLPAFVAEILAAFCEDKIIMQKQNLTKSLFNN